MHWQAPNAPRSHVRVRYTPDGRPVRVENLSREGQSYGFLTDHTAALRAYPDMLTANFTLAGLGQ
jgi:hypothetical protein